MAVSLVVSGVLTWVLVRDLEFSSAQDQLAHDVLQYRSRILLAQCQQRVATTTACPPVRVGGLAQSGLTPVEQYESDLQTISGDLAGDRLLLLDRQRAIIFDSAAPGGVGSATTQISGGR